jgi:hypothetical protein
MSDLPQKWAISESKWLFLESKFPIQDLIWKSVLRFQAQNSFATHSGVKRKSPSNGVMSALDP